MVVVERDHCVGLLPRLQVCVCVRCSGVFVCVRESGGVRYLSGVPLQGFVCVCSRKMCV